MVFSSAFCSGNLSKVTENKSSGNDYCVRMIKFTFTLYGSMIFGYHVMQLHTLKATIIELGFIFQFKVFHREKLLSLPLGI